MTIFMASIIFTRQPLSTTQLQLFYILKILLDLSLILLPNQQQLLKAFSDFCGQTAAYPGKMQK